MENVQTQESRVVNRSVKLPRATIPLYVVTTSLLLKSLEKNELDSDRKALPFKV